MLQQWYHTLLIETKEENVMPVHRFFESVLIKENKTNEISKQRRIKPKNTN
jgi:hypothetical protein